MTIRKALFWVHLAVGITAGAIITIMCLTGAALAFEKQIVAWTERDASRVALSSHEIPRRTMEDLQSQFAKVEPGKDPSAITLSADPRDAVVFSVGRDETYYLNPGTGEVRQPASTGTRKFMRLMTDWHRWLARSGDSRAAGRAITGACNAAFLFLVLSGAILWWPRKWRTKG